MPELPDLAIYIEALEKRIVGQRLERVRIVSPFLLRTVEPAVESAAGVGETDLYWSGGRALANAAFDDCGAVALERTPASEGGRYRSGERREDVLESDSGVG
jgi:hypothetical protein